MKILAWFCLVWTLINAFLEIAVILGESKKSERITHFVNFCLKTPVIIFFIKYLF